MPLDDVLWKLIINGEVCIFKSCPCRWSSSFCLSCSDFATVDRLRQSGSGDVLSTGSQMVDAVKDQFVRRTAWCKSRIVSFTVLFSAATETSWWLMEDSWVVRLLTDRWRDLFSWVRVSIWCWVNSRLRHICWNSQWRTSISATLASSDDSFWSMEMSSSSFTSEELCDLGDEEASEGAGESCEACGAF